MIAWIRNHVTWLALGGALTLAAASGYLASQALGLGAQAPATTTTVNVGQGATGPQGQQGEPGPQGPPGPAGTGGAEQCPTGSSFEAVQLNHPGGHVTIWTCVAP
jgi:hypothetical protein